jgi:hypothetical protein
MIKYLITFYVFIFTNNLFSDCLACWNLNRVIIEQKNGKVVDVYVQWNDAWLDPIKYPNIVKDKFPQIILKLDQQDHITAYYSSFLRKVKYPVDGLIISLKDTIRIPIKEIASIVSKKGKYDGYRGAGFLNVLPNRIYKLLLTKPFAQLSKNEYVYEEFWLSYNNKFGEEYLRLKCKSPIDNQISYFKDLWRKNIIYIIITHD